MTPLRTREVAAFSEALERIHQATNLASFPQHVFAILEDLLPGSFIAAQEFNLRTKEARNATSQPTPPGFMERCDELVPIEHPIFPVVMNGERGALRLSDFISMRQMRRTALYNETFRPLGVRHELVLPLIIPGHVAGFTISRDRDFNEGEVCLAQLVAPHLALAHINAQQLTALHVLQAQQIPQPDALGDLGLTPREAEVLHWVIQGKRNAEIAQILGASARTIQKHVQNVLAKLKVETRTAAAMEAVQRSKGHAKPSA